MEKRKVTFRSKQAIKKNDVFLRYLHTHLNDFGQIAKLFDHIKPIYLVYAVGERSEALRCVVGHSQQNNKNVMIHYCYGKLELNILETLVNKAKRENSWLVLVDYVNNYETDNIMKHHLQSVASVRQLSAITLSSSFNTNDELPFLIWCIVSDETFIKEKIHFQTNIFIHIENSCQNFIENILNIVDYVEPSLYTQMRKIDCGSLLHNVAYLYAVIKSRCLLTMGSWICKDKMNLMGYTCITQIVQAFKDGIQPTSGDVQSASTSNSHKNITISKLKNILFELIFSTYITNAHDKNCLNALIDYWLSQNALKKDVDIGKEKYKISQLNLNSTARLTNVCQNILKHSMFLLNGGEACNIYSCPETLNGYDQYVFTRLNFLFDKLNESTILHVSNQDCTLLSNVSPKSNISYKSNNERIINRGIYSSAVYAVYRNRKMIDFADIASTAINKLPRVYGKDYISEKSKRSNSSPAFTAFIINELLQLYEKISEIKSDLLRLKSICEEDVVVEYVSDSIIEIASELSSNVLPNKWRKLFGRCAPIPTLSLNNWTSELSSKCTHLERVLINGFEKMPSFLLSAFLNPSKFLSFVSLRYAGVNSNDVSVLTSEVTYREKEHVRDPPPDGIFLHGFFVWNCTWDKVNCEIIDHISENGFVQLPVVNVTLGTSKIDKQDNLPGDAVTMLRNEIYSCPVYYSYYNRKEPIMKIDMKRDGIPASRWNLRNVVVTLKPY
ncbi:hypothetical protein A3Q56_02052 [Intoshia linei]|uniref:Dynein heavy chain C-terminal domain-containing protein n=1 Tax=Intoshia linei TaxID=1819745 RepID=A0A177B7T4_9BILA|nr:hypothetical protein A3Q56_02052 [Intoshia linei]